MILLRIAIVKGQVCYEISDDGWIIINAKKVVDWDTLLLFLNMLLKKDFKVRLEESCYEKGCYLSGFSTIYDFKLESLIKWIKENEVEMI